MNIKPDEISKIQTVGRLHGDDIKMIVTHGGFHIFLGKKKKNSKEVEALAASSHRALGLHEISKQFKDKFEPVLQKSEGDVFEDVEDNSKYLPKSLIDNGVELYTLSKGSLFDFILYKHGITIGKYEGSVEQDTLILKSHSFNNDFVKADKDTAKAMATIIQKKIKELRLSGFKYE